MKILIISNLFSGIESFFLNGSNEFHGMPAFFNVFNSLSANDKVSKIHLLFIAKISNSVKKKPCVGIEEKYDGKIVIHRTVIYRGKFDFFPKIILLIGKAIFISLREKFDLNYGHGSFGGVASAVVSLILKKPNIRRQYGVGKMGIQINKLDMFLKDPMTFLNFILPGNDLIVTNDGTFGDRVFSEIGNKKNNFIFRLNGINKPRDFKYTVKSIVPANDKKFLSYVARIVPSKRQHLAIEAIYILKKRGIRVVLYLVGDVPGPKGLKEYGDFLNRVVGVKSLSDQVCFLGSLPYYSSQNILSKSYATLCLYEGSNLGNVFLESLALGVPAIAINNHNSLDMFPEDCFFQLLSSNPEHIANAIQELWNDGDLRDRMSFKAQKYVSENLMTWRERAKLEEDLVLSYCKRKEE